MTDALIALLLSGVVLLALDLAVGLLRGPITCPRCGRPIYHGVLFWWAFWPCWPAGGPAEDKNKAVWSDCAGTGERSQEVAR